jgi:DNA-binding response OmpR family regulator
VTSVQEFKTTASTPLVVVIDGHRTGDTFCAALASEGLRVLHANSGEEGLAVCSESEPDAVVVNTILPDISGHTVLRRLRDATAAPILGLSRRDDEDEALLAFDLGASDVLGRPNRVKESAARICAAIRNGPRFPPSAASQPKPESEDVLRSGPVEIDLRRRDVRVRGVWVHPRPKELELLHLLVSEAGQVVSRERTLKTVWPDQAHDAEQSLNVYVRRLRSLVEEDVSRPRHIMTVRGFGHRFDP